jgi:hypothetical protein
MTIAHQPSVRNTIANTVVDLIDAGTAAANGTIIITTSAVSAPSDDTPLAPTTTGDGLIATLVFSGPQSTGANTTAFKNAAADGANTGQCLANPVDPDLSTLAGTADKFFVRNSDNVVIFSGTVRAADGGGDISLSSLGIGTNDSISITTLTYQAPL